MSKDFICKPLTHIVNNSFKSGVFPDSLKTAKVIPIHKAGDKSDVKNKRPVSILNCFSKVFEKAIHQRLSKFLESHQLIKNCQHGFRRNRSTESAVLDFVKHAYTDIDKGNVALGVFIDFTAAFDCLEHEIFAVKLERLGIRGPMHARSDEELFKESHTKSILQR